MSWQMQQVDEATNAFEGVADNYYMPSGDTPRAGAEEVSPQDAWYAGVRAQDRLTLHLFRSTPRRRNYHTPRLTLER